MKPYYDEGGVTLYRGDAREIVPTLLADALVTDPPYGVTLGASDRRGGRHGLAKDRYSSFDDSYENFVGCVVPVLSMALDRVRRGAVFSGPHLQEQPKASAIGGIYCPAGSGRHSWGFKTFLPVLFYGTDPLLHKGARPNTIQSTEVAEKNGHPCPKPLGWMAWLVGRVTLPGEMVLDPFAGSGTTLVAAKRLGRRAVGVEIDERYCEIAAERLRQSVFTFEPPAPDAERDTPPLFEGAV
jgi:DNA modification methylase